MSLFNMTMRRVRKLVSWLLALALVFLLFTGAYYAVNLL